MNMKREFIVVFVCLCLAFVLIAGCTTPATTPAAQPATHAVTPAVSGVPDLVGNCSGTSRGYVDKSGYQVVDDAIQMNIVEQTDRLFKGQLFFPSNGTVKTKEFAGILGADGKTLRTVEYPGGFSDGIVISADELQLIFRDQATPSTITIDSLKRSTGSGQLATPTVQPMPDLTGKWNGTATGYIDTSGYQVTRDVVSLNVTGQTDRLFTGQVSFVMNGTLETKDFAGALDRDGKTFRTVESPDGFNDGVILSADEIELTFRDNADPSRIVIDSLKRSTATSQVATPPVLSMPGIVGNWSGISRGYMKTASGYQVIQGTMTMKVTGQTDRLFTGQVAYVVNGSPVTKDVAGVFGRNGKTIETVEYPGGFSDGVVISTDEIQLIFRDQVNTSTIAMDTFRRAT